MIGFAKFLAEVSSLEQDGTRDPAATTRAPYRWQEAFAQACLDGQPPPVVGVPTGSGKTTAVDALVWALAAQAAGGERRTLGVRIVWAIDRRILVDEVHEHASRLARRLDLALANGADPLNEAATALAELSGGRPLVATRWRGGLEGRPELQSPLQAEVITSTVAQIGSRLLFRGYGVGRRSLSLAAGLAACDTTICLDEAHLADPFRQTCEGIATMQSEAGGELDLPGLHLIELTATPPEGRGALSFGEEDKRQLGRRWAGAKSARLVAPESDKDGDRVKALVDECLALVAGGAATLACVTNTVARARRVWSALGAELDHDVDLGLLIGPQRPADRDAFLNPARRGVLFDGAAPEKPLVVVATQTFEVGLDVDVGALVTESASSAALVQRLGRLNRAGRTTGTAVIVRDADSWLYGEDEERAWDWLQSLQGPDGGIDVSVAALHEDRNRPIPKASSDAPLLTPEVVECLVQTAPMPHLWGDPDVESYLKGAESDPTADVEICWRSDLRLDAVEAGGVDYSKMLIELAPPDRRELLGLNVLKVRSLLAARLSGSNAAAARAALADVDIEGEAASAPVPGPPPDSDPSPRFLVVRHGEVHLGTAGAGGGGAITVTSIAPGDLLVLPTGLGGCDRFGLNPQAGEATDVAPDADPAASGPAKAIRLTSGAIKTAIAPKRVPRRAVDSACLQTWKELPGVDRLQRQRALRNLATKLAQLMPDHRALVELAQRLADDNEQRLILSLRAFGPTDEDGTPRLSVAKEEASDSERAEQSPEENQEDEEDGRHPDDTEDRDEVERKKRGETLEASWVLRIGEMRAVDERLDRAALPSPSPPTLVEHSRSVRAQLEEYVERLDLPPRIGESLLLAAAGHDLGKADPRFQGFLHGGRAPLGAAPIAKSTFGTRDPGTARVAAQVSGLPTGFRHEIESVAIVADVVAARSGAAVDLDLVLACIAGHHGYGLPVPDIAAAGGAPAQLFGAELDGTFGVASGDGLGGWNHGEWLERFWRVVDRYGAWRFAYLLGLLVLSDRIRFVEGRVMGLELTWMQPEAPYMPLATVGLLAVLEGHGEAAAAGWLDTGASASLTVMTDLPVEQLAQCVLDAPWPDLDAIPWGPAGPSQGLKPTLAEHPAPLTEFRRLIEGSGATESRLLQAILCNGALDAKGSPLRSRLLRGVKSDLASIRKRPKRIGVEGLVGEAEGGPDFVKGSSGLGLGFVPEIHTFGATTGPEASTVGVYSPLLYLLLWHGIMALPPVPIARGQTRSVGGPLVTEPDVLSWPRWRCPLGLRSLKTLLTLPAIHADAPDTRLLVQRDVDAVFRARAEPINSMIAVFRWGERIV